MILKHTNWARKIETHKTPLFLENSRQKNPMQENQCSGSEGLLLLSSSKFWIHHWIPHKVIQLQREILAEALWVYLIQLLRNHGWSSPKLTAPRLFWLPQRSVCVSPTSTSLGVASLVWLVNLLPRRFDFCLSVQTPAPGFWKSNSSADFRLLSLPLHYLCVALLALHQPLCGGF